jgi:hypothetical protein
MDLNEDIVLLGHDGSGHMGSIIDKLAPLLGVISYRICYYLAFQGRDVNILQNSLLLMDKNGIIVYT